MSENYRHWYARDPNLEIFLFPRFLKKKKKLFLKSCLNISHASLMPSSQGTRILSSSNELASIQLVLFEGLSCLFIFLWTTFPFK